MNSENVAVCRAEAVKIKQIYFLYSHLNKQNVIQVSFALFHFKLYPIKQEKVFNVKNLLHCIEVVTFHRKYKDFKRRASYGTPNSISKLDHQNSN